MIVKATNSAGTTTATTPITGLITGLLPKNTALPSISGLLQEGGLLTVASGTWTGTQPITYTYQWQLCNSCGQSCSNITGATGETLSLSPADIGSTLQVIVKATNTTGTTTATTPITGLITGLLPKNTALPSISGLLQEGGLLTVASGTWTGTQPITYSYQWQLCNSARTVVLEHHRSDRRNAQPLPRRHRLNPAGDRQGNQHHRHDNRHHTHHRY